MTNLISTVQLATINFNQEFVNYLAEMEITWNETGTDNDQENTIQKAKDDSRIFIIDYFGSEADLVNMLIEKFDMNWSEAEEEISEQLIYTQN